jgi:hypothetical protein
MPSTTETFTVERELTIDARPEPAAAGNRLSSRLQSFRTCGRSDDCCLLESRQQACYFSTTQAFRCFFSNQSSYFSSSFSAAELMQ